MTPVTLPSDPRPEVISWEPIDFGTSLKGPLGGATQRINRLGNRWAMTASIPAMDLEDGRTWSAALAKGLLNGVLFEVRQPGLSVGVPGAPLVAGANQVGYILLADGFSSGYSMVAGQFFSIIVNGQRYLHQIAADVSADGAGLATLEIYPALRISPEDNAVLEFATPYIQGLLRDPPSWYFQTGRVARGFTFTIEEAR